jgi:hypothetical protein
MWIADASKRDGFFSSDGGGLGLVAILSSPFSKLSNLSCTDKLGITRPLLMQLSNPVTG